mmetsp:Transcript_66744/g.116022  ORF Transcript_66744/g.116022 Transcript_66744/m.116022 type:complete len:81 (-) Transcript_66744:91-333(-)
MFWWRVLLSSAPRRRRERCIPTSLISRDPLGTANFCYISSLAEHIIFCKRAQCGVSVKIQTWKKKAFTKEPGLVVSEEQF